MRAARTPFPSDIASWFEPVRILGYTALIGAVNVVLITALATLGSGHLQPRLQPGRRR